MIFDQPPAELPTATLRPHESGAQLSIDLRNWLAARWRWFRPRSVPVFVAFLGMLAVLGSASYLRSFARESPELVTARPLQVHIASNEPTTTATRPGLVQTDAAAAAAAVPVHRHHCVVPTP